MASTTVSTTPPRTPPPRLAPAQPKPQPSAPPASTSAPKPPSNGPVDSYEPIKAPKTEAEQKLATQKKMDAFKDKYTPEYDVGGAKVKSATPFRMFGGNNQTANEKEMKKAEAAGVLKGPDPSTGYERMKKDLTAAKKWDPAMESAAKRVSWGRGRPDDVKKVTQALIDAGKLPPAQQLKDGTIVNKSGEERIREMQWKYGIGVDCAGYVSQASPASQGKTPAEAGTDKVVGAPYGMLAPSAPAYSKVPPKAPDGSIDAKPGDIIALDDPNPKEPGHFVTVYDKKKLTPAETTALGSSPFLAGKKGIIQYEVDSSWGASGNPQAGGVERKQWLYNSETGQWADYDPKTKTITPQPEGPYGHTVNAVYRPKP